MKSVECVERLPEFGCGVKSFRLNIFIGNRLTVPFPDAKDLQFSKPTVGVKGALCPMDGTGKGSGSQVETAGLGLYALPNLFCTL